MSEREVPVWEKPDPTDTENPLSKKKKASAKARAKAAGRPYPNLIDNMAAAKSVKKEDKPATLNITGKLHRVYREKNGDIVVDHAGTKKQNGKYDKINLSSMAGVKSVKAGVNSSKNWHKKNPHTYVNKEYSTPAWTRSEGKNPKGGLNAKGRASAKAEGHNLKPPVKSGDNPRRASFLARMGNMPGPERKPNGEPTRLLLSLQAWGASSKADAKKKAAAISNVSKSDEELRRKILRDGRKISYLSAIPLAGKQIANGAAAVQAPKGLKIKSAASQSIGSYTATLPVVAGGVLAMRKLRKVPDLPSKKLVRTLGGIAAAGLATTIGGGMVGQSIHRKKHMDEYLKHYKKNANVSKARKLPVTGMWKHLSGQTTPLRIVGQNPYAKDSFDVVDYKDVKRILPRSSIIFTKPKNVSKSMEYSVSMTQSRFGGSSAVGKAFVEPVEKSAMGIVRSGVGQSKKSVAQASQASTKEWSASARADMRRRAERAMSGAEGKDIVLRPSRGVIKPKPADNTRASAPRSGRNASTEIAVRRKGAVATQAKKEPEFLQTTPLRSVGSDRTTFLGMPGMRMPDAPVAQVASSSKKVKPKKQKVAVTTRSYAPEAAAAAGIGGTLGYAGYKNVNKAVDEFGNQIPAKSNTSTLAMAGGAGAAAFGAKKFGDARVAPVKLDAAATQAKRNAAFNAKRLSDAKVAATVAGANKTRFKGGTELKRAQNNLRIAQNRADISASQAKGAKKAKKVAGLKQRDLRWRGAALLAGGTGLAGMGAAMKEKGL